MNTRTNYALLSTFLLLASFVTLHAQRTAPDRQSAAARAGAALAGTFVENRGQWPANVRYVARRNGLDVWVTDKGVTFDAHTTTGTLPERTSVPTNAATIRRTGERIRMEFVATGNIATRRLGAAGMERLPGVMNFLVGKRPADWITNVRRFAEVRVETGVPGVSARLYSDDGTPRYDLMLEPGTAPSAVALRFAGARSITTTPAGDLAIATPNGSIIQRGLVAYQTTGGDRRTSVACRFDVGADGLVRFVPAAYDHSLPLVIDPLVYSSYLGGSGDDAAYAMAVDDAGNAYLTGYAALWLAPPSDAFPTTVGAYDRTFNGGPVDAFVTKFDCISDSLVYSTIIGGGGYEDGRGIVLDASRNAYVCGYTGSSDFPTTAGSFLPVYAGGQADGFVFKLNPTGTALVFSTFVGGQVADGAYALALASDGTIRVTGYTASADFPIPSGAYDNSFNGQPGDVFVGTLSASGTAWTSATFVGGSANDAAIAMTLDGANNAYITGTTASTDFPTPGSPYDATYNGGPNDGFLIKVSSGNSALLYSTFLGGALEDQPSDIELAGANAVAICGFTASHDFPTTPAAYNSFYHGGAYDAFVGRFNFVTNAFDFSGLLGTTTDDYAYAVAVDASGNTYVTGTTISDSFPRTDDAFDRVHKQNTFDGFLTELNPGGTLPIYSTYIGGSNRDVPYDVKLGGTNIVYLCGTTKSVDFPTTPHRWSDSLGRVRNGNEVTFSYDAFITKLDLRNVVVQAPDADVTLCRGAQLAIQWSSPRVATVHIELSTPTGTAFPTTLASGVTGSTFTWTVPNDIAAGTYRIRVSAVGDTTIAGLTRTIRIGPKLAIANEPADVTACRGEQVTFRVNATGTNLKYQWGHQGTPIPGATSATYTFTPTTAADAGNYGALITDSCGASTNTRVAVLTLHPAPIATAVPGSNTVCVGEAMGLAVSFAVTPAGPFQWYRNGTPIPGATNPVYFLQTATEADSGSYTLSVTYDPCGTHPLILGPIAVRVLQFDLTSQPADVHVKLGESATFTVAAPGSSLSYQWRKSGAAIPGATGPTFAIAAVTAADTGTYDVVVTGPCARLSRGAKLIIDGVGGVAGPTGSAAALHLSVAPNPAAGSTTITLEGPARVRSQATRLALYDVMGRSVLDLTSALRTGGYRSATFDATTLATGTYYCRATCDDGSTAIMTVVIER